MGSGWSGLCPVSRPSRATAARVATRRSSLASRTWWRGRRARTDRQLIGGIGIPGAGPLGSVERLPAGDGEASASLNRLSGEHIVCLRSGRELPQRVLQLGAHRLQLAGDLAAQRP